MRARAPGPELALVVRRLWTLVLFHPLSVTETFPHAERAKDLSMKHPAVAQRSARHAAALDESFQTDPS